MILLIDTSQETGYAALAQDGKILHWEENTVAKEHASWLHMAVNRIVAAANITLRDVQAVAVVAGPGSYTGLRVGMAAAKGFCYALKIPLITLNTLDVMAASMIEAAEEKNALICPLIDARRDEVFTAVYQILPSTVNRQPSTVNPQPSTIIPPSSTINRQPSTIIPQPSTVNRQPPTVNLLPPQAMILDKNSFEKELSQNFVIFFGTGAAKWQKICFSEKALFLPQSNLLHAFADLACKEFLAQNWADPVYSEPVYLKEFFTY